MLICFVCIARVVVVVTIVVSGISCGCLATPCDQHMFCDYPGICRILQDILGYNCTPWISIALPEKRLANNCYKNLQNNNHSTLARQWQAVLITLILLSIFCSSLKGVLLKSFYGFFIGFLGQVEP